MVHIKSSKFCPEITKQCENGLMSTSKVLFIFLFFLYTSPIVCCQVNIFGITSERSTLTVTLTGEETDRSSQRDLGLRASLARGDAGTPSGSAFCAFCAICAFCAFCAFCALCTFCALTIDARSCPAQCSHLDRCCGNLPSGHEELEYWPLRLLPRSQTEVWCWSAQFVELAVCLANFPLPLILQ